MASTVGHQVPGCAKTTDTHAMAHTAAFRFPPGILVPGGLSARCTPKAKVAMTSRTPTWSRLEDQTW